MLNLSELTEPALIDTDLAGTDRNGVLQALADLVARRAIIDDPSLLIERLTKRETLGSTGIGHGIAVPHCRMAGLEKVVLAIGICRQAIAFEALDGAPVRMFFLVISPEESPAAHLRCLAAIAHWVKDAARREELFMITAPEELFHQLPGSPRPVPPDVEPVAASDSPGGDGVGGTSPDPSKAEGPATDEHGNLRAKAGNGKAAKAGRAARILSWTSRSSK